MRRGADRRASRPAVRDALAAAAVLVLCGSLARGQDPPATPAARADEFAAAVRAGDEAKLTALATRNGPDPWLVADQLCQRGDGAAAARFAGAFDPHPDVDGLPRFVNARLAAPPSQEVLSALASSVKPSDRGAAIAAVDAARHDAAPFDRARLSSALASLLRSERRLEDAAAAETAAADAAESLGWLHAAADALWRAGADHARTADYARVRGCWGRELALERRRGDTVRAAHCAGNLAGVEAELGNYRTAFARFDDALASAEGAGPAGRGLALAILGNLATLQNRCGDFARALATCRRARERLPTAGAEGLRVRFLLVEGTSIVELGAIDRALELHRQALADAETAKDSVLAATCRGAIARDVVARAELGDVISEFGEVQNALETHRRALVAAEATQDEKVAAACRCAVERDLAVQADLDDAIAGLGQALDVFEKAGRDDLVVSALANLADANGRRGDASAARKHGERALAIATRLHDDLDAANVMFDLARTCRQSGDAKAAEEYATRAVEIAERLDSSSLRSNGWYEVAANALAAHDVPRAVDASRRATTAIVEATSGLAEGQGAQARARYVRVFRTAAAAAIASGDAATVLEFAERGRAVDFLASLEQGDAIRTAAIPPALREAEEAARTAEAEASARLAAARGDGDRATLKARQIDLDTARAKHEDAIGSIRRDVRGASAIYPRPVADAEVRATLGADDALVIYSLADEKCAALVLTQKEMRFVPLGATKDVAAACAAWDPAAGAETADAAVAALKKALVDPLALAASTKRVLVSPDGDVYHAPLAAILAGREVVHVPSASSYLLLAADKALRGSKVLAVGAPDYTGTNLVALPESGAEASVVGNVAGDVVVSGKAATEAHVRAEISKETRWRSVHFAVHGVVNEKRPMLCGLALTAAPPDDGLLTALEVLQQPVPSDLVVLSACGSGGGRVFTGEGLVGMPRAFLFAGSPRVIASSWKVDDAATRALMTKFYELWRTKGLRASAALAGAQDYVRAAERWRHPRFWAAWTLWGIGD